MEANPKTAERYSGIVDECGKWTGRTRLIESELQKPLLDGRTHDEVPW